MGEEKAVGAPGGKGRRRGPIGKVQNGHWGKCTIEKVLIRLICHLREERQREGRLLRDRGDDDGLTTTKMEKNVTQQKEQFRVRDGFRGRERGGESRCEKRKSTGCSMKLKL